MAYNILDKEQPKHWELMNADIMAVRQSDMLFAEIHRAIGDTGTMLPTAGPRVNRGSQKAGNWSKRQRDRHQTQPDDFHSREADLQRTVHGTRNQPGRYY